MDEQPPMLGAYSARVQGLDFRGHNDNARFFGQRTK
jgi:hypothetical protein